MNPKGKVCVVTGGASGIGEATARAFAKAGAKGVVVADLNGDKLAGRGARHQRPCSRHRRRQGSRHQGAGRRGRGEIRPGRHLLLQRRHLAQGPGRRLRRRLGYQLARPCHEPCVCRARPAPRHAGARLGLPAQHRVGRRPARLAELDALWGNEVRCDLARRASCHSIRRSRHPRLRAVPSSG